MAPEDECDHEMFVVVRWERRDVAVPLAQLKGMKIDPQTQQAIEDWHYWISQGYEL
ncbi:MAG TPA: calcium-binding protein [Herpetosiphonaceae bacterium]